MRRNLGRETPREFTLIALGFVFSLVGTCKSVVADDWKPAQGPLMTKWGAEVSPTTTHLEYPRPQLVREDWLNLNGLWDYAIRPRKEGPPETWDGQILVPFPIESALSGVMKKVSSDQRLWYRRKFQVPPKFLGGRVLLNFGAVDWESTVYVNGRKITDHRGGYDPFSAEITTALVGNGEHELVVSVWDPTDKSFQPRGKQINNPHGIWYTPVTGIWQTVWLEPVGISYVSDVKITPNVDASSVKIEVIPSGGSLAEGPRKHFRAIVLADGKEVARGEADWPKPLDLKIPAPRLWSPDDPYLYDVRIELDGDDLVTSYFGLRKIGVAKDDAGVNRLFLNNKPLFQLGPLDQGWWPDGLYTAPSDAALKYDLEMTKKLGFNMCRKHVKVEPERWYYWCDKLGLLVWQDMPSGDQYIGPNDPDPIRSAESEANFLREWEAIINANRNHPSIVVWVPFNEGWGQFKTNEVLEFTKKLDPTRIVDGPSGWADRGGGDLHDAHIYPGPGMPKLESERAVVLGEFGGLGLPLEGHVWVNDKKNWGYQNFKDKTSLTKAYKNLFYKLQGLHAQGLAAAVYTQTTDVEIEVNGLLTYDRAVLKIDAEEIAALHKSFYGPPLKLTEVMPDSRQKPQDWQYTFEKPADGWEKPNFAVKNWKTGPGGFGTAITPGAKIGTEWNSDDIWLRRTFKIDDAKFTAGNVRLQIHHDEDAEIYLNGIKVAELVGFTTDYVTIPLDAVAQKALRSGENVIAVHCHQSTGGQYIDLGLVEVK